MPPAPPLVQRFIEARQALLVVIYGSWARGDLHDQSDLDLLLVLPSYDARRREIVEEELLGLAGGPEVRVDLLLTNLETLEREAPVKGTISNTALAEGKLSYRADPVPAEVREWASRPATPGQILSVARQTLVTARRSLLMAEWTMGTTGQGPLFALRRLRQSIKESLTGPLILAQQEVRGRCTPEDLHRLLPAGQLSCDVAGLAWIQDLFEQTRYLLTPRAVDEEDVRKAMVLARDVLSAVEQLPVWKN